MNESVNSSNKSGVWMINQENEKRIVVTHVNVRGSIVFLIAKLIVLDIIAIFGVLVFFSPLISPLSVEIKTQIISYNIFYFGLLLFGKIALTLFIVLQWLNEYYEISPIKISHKSGIIWRKEDTFDLSRDKSTRITELGVKQGLMGRIFNYGTLFFYDRGVFKYYYMYYIHNPLRYLEILRSLLPDADVQKDTLREHVKDKDVLG